jgi:putative nucleotidyltransferase with HDIG domain
MSSARRTELEPRVVGLILVVATSASTVLVALHGSILSAFADNPRRALTLLLLVLVLQAFSIQVYGRGSMSMSAIGLLAAGFMLGVGPAMVMAVLAALVQWARARGVLYKAVFDVGNFALTAGSGAAVYHLILLGGDSPGLKLTAATLAGVTYSAVNNGLLCLAITLSEGESFRRVWMERFHWARYHFLAWGPLALAAAIAYQKVGVSGLIAFVLPPALMLVSWRDYLKRTTESVQEVRDANSRLELANADLNELFRFASGIAGRAHDHSQLMLYTEEALSALTGGRVTTSDDDVTGAIAIRSSGQTPVGFLRIEKGESFDGERWSRLQPTILPQLATAIEGAGLVERLRKVHLDTIAALSRSMEAKDYYTGGHTERVAQISVALAKRLGYDGSELEAIEVGALLHDIGKIGVPEHILHKPEPLDADEWSVIKQHPVISDYILSDVDLPPIVRQIARWSHERVDGAGYPDGLAGDDIPLPARIVFVADGLDALTSDRPYRRGRPVWAALDELRSHTGTQFCPTVVAALERVHDEEPETLELLTRPSRKAPATPTSAPVASTA